MNLKRKQKSDELEYRLLVLVTMPMFFVSILARRAMPWNRGRDKRSILTATRCAAYNTIPFAFM